MVVKNLTFPITLTDGKNIYDDNLDVFVKLENGCRYRLVVGRYKNILSLMNKEKSNFLLPGEPIIIVRKLTMEIIEEAIEAYAEKNEVKLHH